MERIPGVSLESLWREMDIEMKERETRVVVRYVGQLREQCSFEPLLP